jgi:hypothetical protein
MLALALGMFWISFGPLSVLGGHFEFLKMSPGAADFTPAMAWFLLTAQVWVVFQIVPRGSQKWRWIAAALSVVYLIVPGFRLLEWLPLYSNIRAPFDYFPVTWNAREYRFKINPGTCRVRVVLEHERNVSAFVVQLFCKENV